MMVRATATVIMMMLCFAAHAQAPRLLLHATFDGSCSLAGGGTGELLSAEFVDGRDGQAIKSTVEREPAAMIPLGAADPEQGTLMFWFRPDRPSPGPDDKSFLWWPLNTIGASGPSISISQELNQSTIAARNPWDEKHASGPFEVYGHLIPGKWYHMAYTWDRANDDLCFWLYGVAQADTLGKGGDLLKTDTPWGEMLSVGSTMGAVDDLRIYDRAMTGDEIKAVGAYRDGECMYREGRIFFDTTLDTEHLKGDLLIEDTFDQPWEDNWVLEGNGILTNEDGRLHMQERSGHVVLWNKHEAPKDFIAEWDFTPEVVDGLCIVFFCAKGRNGESIFDPSLAPRSGSFTSYTRGDINCYHISYFRNTSARQPNCAMRKNYGFWRVTEGYDWIPMEAGVTSRITIVKRGAHIQFAINGHVSIDWVDDGITRGGVWGEGNIGLRQMLNTDGYYDNFRVWAVK